MTLTASAVGAIPLTLNQFSTSQTAVLLSLAAGNSAAATGTWGLFERPASLSSNGVNFRAVMNQNYSSNGGVGGEAYTNEVFGEGFNQSNVIGIRADTNKHSCANILEYKYNSGGVYVAEWHKELISTAGVTHRWFTAAVPITASAGGSLGILLDQVYFSTYAGVQKILWNNGSNVANIGDGTTGYEFYFEKNNSSVVRQKNAAGSAYIPHFYVNADNLLYADSKVLLSPDATNATWAGISMAFQGTPVSGLTGFTISMGAGTDVTLIPFTVSGNTNHEIQTRITNSHASGAATMAVAAAGPAQIRFTDDVAQNWCIGKRSDEDFEICGGFNLGSSTALTINKTTLTAAFSGAITASVADAAAIPVLTLTQSDVDQDMIEFVSTIGTGNAIEAVGAKTLTTTHFIKVTIPGGLTRYFPVGTIA